MALKVKAQEKLQKIGRPSINVFGGCFYYNL